MLKSSYGTGFFLSPQKVMKLGMTLVDDTGTRYYPKTGVSSEEYLYAMENHLWK